MGYLALIAALLAIGGAIRFIIPLLSNNVPVLIGYGVYVSTAAAVLGLIFTIIVLAGNGEQSKAVSKGITSPV